MKKKILLMVVALAIGLVTVGNYAFAKDMNGDSIPFSNPWTKEGYGYGCHGLGYQHSEIMAEIMKKTGYDNMAKWIEDGNTEEIDKYINNLTVREYDEMMQTFHQHRNEYFQDQDKGLYNLHGMGMMRGGGLGHHGRGRMGGMFRNRQID